MKFMRQLAAVYPIPMTLGQIFIHDWVKENNFFPESSPLWWRDLSQIIGGLESDHLPLKNFQENRSLSFPI